MYWDPSGYSKKPCDAKDVVEKKPETGNIKDPSARRRAAQEKLDKAAAGTKGNKNGEPDFLFAEGVIVPRNTGYSSFSKLKKDLPAISKEVPAPGRGNYHHIIEENPSNLAKYSPEFIHNKQNIVPLNSAKGEVHGKVSGYYSSRDANIPGNRVRDYVSKLPADKQFEFGRTTINNVNQQKKLTWDVQKGTWIY